MNGSGPERVVGDFGFTDAPVFGMEVEGDAVRPHYADAKAVLEAVAAAGVDYDDVIAQLEKEGVDKFVASWDELLETVQGQLDGAKG